MCEASAMQLADDGTRIDLYRCFVLAMNGVKESWGAVEAVDRVYDSQKAADFRQGGAYTKAAVCCCITSQVGGGQRMLLGLVPFAPVF